MQKRSAILTVLVLLGISIVITGCPRPHRHRPHIPRPPHLFQPQVPLSSTVLISQAEAIPAFMR